MSQPNTQYQTALAEAITRIPTSQDQETLFKSQITELRKLLQVDRVAILRFYHQLDGAGQFICEDVADGWKSLLNLKVENNFFPNYQKESIHAVTDIDEIQLTETYGKILQEFQVKADLVAPIFKQNQTTETTVPELWGFLCIHQCSSSRQWQDLEIEYVEKTATNLAVIIRNTQLLEAAQYQVEQQKTLARVIKRIRGSLDSEEIFQVTATEVRHLLQADRVAVFRFYPERDWEGEFVSEDLGAEWESALAAKVYDYCFGEQFAPEYQAG
ncbi:GAF domain-containing protein, partial [Okeania sp.]|uniref:GAF domain-containing protein n=1 Tax=Okeania sp. TaxID=3100323 RepID=UPI002B4AC338